MIHLFISHSCPTIFEFLEDIEFDDQFELSLFETKSESATGSTVINPEFIKYLEIEKANRSIDTYILNIQNSIVATNIPLSNPLLKLLVHQQLLLIHKFTLSLLSFLPFPCNHLYLIRNL